MSKIVLALFNLTCNYPRVRRIRTFLGSKHMSDVVDFPRNVPGEAGRGGPFQQLSCTDGLCDTGERGDDGAAGLTSHVIPINHHEAFLAALISFEQRCQLSIDNLDQVACLGLSIVIARVIGVLM